VEPSPRGEKGKVKICHLAVGRKKGKPLSFDSNGKKKRGGGGGWRKKKKERE